MYIYTIYYVYILYIMCIYIYTIIYIHIYNMCTYIYIYIVYITWLYHLIQSLAFCTPAICAVHRCTLLYTVHIRLNEANGVWGAGHSNCCRSWCLLMLHIDSQRDMTHGPATFPFCGLPFEGHSLNRSTSCMHQASHLGRAFPYQPLWDSESCWKMHCCRIPCVVTILTR